MIAPAGNPVRDNPPLTGGLWAVVLAAGGARRFGRHKLLQQIGTESLLARAVSCAATVAPGRTVVVLGCSASRLRGALHACAAQSVLNRRWRSGMASSLQAGLAAVPPAATAVLVLLADQYAIGVPDLRRLVAAWSRDPARPAAAECDGRLAAPAILPRAWFPLVQRLEGDEGARRLLREGPEPSTRVPMPAARLDLDDRSTLAGFRQFARRAKPACGRRMAKPRTGRYIR